MPPGGGPASGSGASCRSRTSMISESRRNVYSQALLACTVEAAHDLMGRDTVRISVLQGDQTHQHVAVRPLAAELLCDASAVS